MSSKKEILETEEKNMGILNFVLIGAKSSGKTIYLASLWGKGILGYAGKKNKDYIERKWKEVESTGQAEPNPEGSYEELNFVYTHKKYGRVYFKIEDYDGNYTETISKDVKSSEEERKKLEKSVVSSEGVFFFIPYEEDPDRLRDYAQEIDIFVNLAQKNSFNLSPIPASIVITKWDDSPYFRQNNEVDAAIEYIKKNKYLERTFRLIKDNFKNTKIIPLSSFETYNMTEPIDYSLGHTFKLWYETAQKLYKEKKYDKLLKYLALRYNDTKFNEVYDFNKIYDEAQKLYIEIIKKELSKKSDYLEKEKYLQEISFYYKTKGELLKPLFEEVGREKKRVLFRKRRNKTVATLAFVALVTIIWQYANKLEVEERYNKIIDNYEKNVSYIDMKDDLVEFLKDYKNVSPMYAFADIPSKRDRILKIENDLKEQDRKSTEKQIEDIMNDPKLSAAEKKIKIDKMKSKVADNNQKDDLDKESGQLALEDNTEKWQNEAEDCLKNCKGEKGIEILNELLARAGDSTKIISNDKVNEKVSQLIYKKKILNQSLDMQSILGQIESAQSSSELNSVISALPNSFQNDKKVKDKIVASYLSVFNEIDSLDQLTDTVALVPDFIFTDSRVHDKAVSIVQSLHTEDFHTYRGTRLLDDLKAINAANDFNKYIKQDISRFITAKEQYRELLKEISNKEKYEDLQSIDYSAYNNFENFEKENIKTALTEQIDKSFNELYGSRPMDKFLLAEVSAWLDSISKFDEFSIGAIGYQYHIPSDKQAGITEARNEYNIISNLKDNGISGISVELVGHEDNSFRFGCGMTKEDDVAISGFSNTLSYDNKSQCNNDAITYFSPISLRAQGYSIELSDDDVFTDKLNEYISFDTKELYQLYNNEVVSKMIDQEKLELRFRKSGY